MQLARRLKVGSGGANFREGHTLVVRQLTDCFGSSGVNADNVE